MEHSEPASSAASVSYSVSALQQPAEILVDPYGVPHIYAATFYDAFFAQGFNAARDRLWQMDLWRRRGLGLLSEIFGSSYIERDRAARLFLFRGEMRSEWLAYGSDTKRVVTAFVDGINEYVKLVEENPELLPVEFKVLGYRPALWSPEDIPRIRSHGLYGNVQQEVARSLTLRTFGPEVEALRSRLEPEKEITVPEGLDLDLIPDDVLSIYELATSPVDFAGEVLESALRASSELEGEGSNNWVVSAERTSTGRPLLANDPHRVQTLPSLRYIAHLVAPGLNVIGAGEPVLPGISIGHNGQIAFGLTIFSIDQEDLYCYETNPDSPSEYRYKGRWDPMDVERQTIEVSGRESVEVELKFTRHGPVIYEDPDKSVAFAVRAAWLEPGMAPYLGSIDYMRAQNWNEFLAAMNRWGSPGENQLYADVGGNIGWKPAGLVPVRPNWDGLLPVPGDGRYEWEGFMDVDELPVEFNPPRGWIATANEMNLSEDYPHQEKQVAYEWYTPFRYERIEEVLEENQRFSIDDAVTLQTDSVSVPARRIVAQLSDLHSDEHKVASALDELRQWDCVLATDSTPAAIFEVWYRLFLRKALLGKIVPYERRNEALAVLTKDAFESDAEVGDARVILELIESPDKRFGQEPEKARNEAMISSLRQAIDYLEYLLGSDMATWRWGRLHHALFYHPLSELVESETGERPDIGPVARGGSGDTVGQTGYITTDFRQIKGSSWRVVVDVGNWDGSMAMNSPGQSGEPGSKHYADLFTRWAEGRAFPLMYAREDIERSAEQRILLKPTE